MSERDSESQECWEPSAPLEDEDEEEEISSRVLGGISSSATIVLSVQINQYMVRYFSPGEMFLLVVVIHSLLSVLPQSLPGFNASFSTIKGLFQTIVVQMGAGYLTSGYSAVAALFNLSIALLFIESIPLHRISWGSGVWMERDIELLNTSLSYIFSGRVSDLLSSLGIPLIGASLGLFFGGGGLFGRTLILTGVNTLCAVSFDAIGGGDLSLAWPLLLLSFVNEVAARIRSVSPFLDYGMYRASNAVYTALADRGLGPDIQSLLFVFVLFAWDGLAVLRADGVWDGLCVLVLIRAASDWFLESIALATRTDPVVGGLCVVTAVHFAGLMVEVVARRAKK